MIPQPASARPPSRLGHRVATAVLVAIVLLAAPVGWLAGPARVNGFARSAEGPADVKKLQGYLVSVEGNAGAVDDKTFDLAAEAARRASIGAPTTVAELTGHGFRWSVGRDWKADDKSRGSLRLSQFATGTAAVTEAGVLVDRLAGDLTNEEWPVTGLPTAAVFVRDRAAEGITITGVAVKGTVVAQIELRESRLDARAGVESLLRRQHEHLPSAVRKQTIATRDAKTPPDLRMLPLPMPGGATKINDFGINEPFIVPPDGQVTTAQLADSFDDAGITVAWLQDLHLRKAVLAGWSSADQDVFITIYQLGSAEDALRLMTWQSDTSGLDWSSRREFARIPTGQYYFIPNNGVAMDFAKGDIAVIIAVYNDRRPTAEAVDALAEAQYARLP